jgi:hypothetical protein
VVCELKFEHPTIDFLIKILVDHAYTISKANFDEIHVVNVANKNIDNSRTSYDTVIIVFSK